MMLTKQQQEQVEDFFHVLTKIYHEEGLTFAQVMAISGLFLHAVSERSGIPVARLMLGAVLFTDVNVTENNDDKLKYEVRFNEVEINEK